MASVWAELKRRNVVRVAIAYAIVSWLILQVTDVLNELLGLPEWAGKLVLLLLLVGFVLAIFVAWAYEVTPEGIKKEKDVDRSKSITHVTGRRLDFVIIGVLAIAVGYFIVERTFWRQSETLRSQALVPAEVEKSIAVLPFENMSADPEQEYFSDGIAEEILNGLVRVPGLRVVARTSSFSFRGRNIDIREIGEALSANHVLEGSVRKAGDRLRITAQLINVIDGYHLWSETYDRQVDDIFAIQEEIARAVVSALEVTLGFSGEAALLAHGTDNTDAYNWFLRGNYYIGRQTPESFDKAIESYAKAIELDPGFASGYGGIAYGLAYASAFVPYETTVDRVRDAYAHALAIDQDDVHALLAKAVDVALTNHDFVTAERSIRKALDVSGNSTLAVDAYWWIVLSGQRRFDEALQYLAIAERADPLSPLVKQGIGINLSAKGNIREAIPYLEAANELNPNDQFALYWLAVGNARIGQFSDGDSAVGQLQSLTGHSPWTLSARAILELAKKNDTAAGQALDELIALSVTSDDPVLVAMIGNVLTHMGDIDAAIDWFEKSIQNQNPFVNIAPIFFNQNRDLWEHPRMQQLLHKINLDDASVVAAKAAASSL